MTRTPVMDSRRRVFMRSMKPCSTVKTGADFHTAKAMAPRVSTMTASSSQPMTGSMPKAMMVAMTQVTGTGLIMTKDMMMVCWTTLASERVRVIMEPAPSWPNS